MSVLTVADRPQVTPEHRVHFSADEDLVQALSVQVALLRIRAGLADDHTPGAVWEPALPLRGVEGGDARSAPRPLGTTVVVAAHDLDEITWIHCLVLVSADPACEHQGRSEKSDEDEKRHVTSFTR
jgi:hypothetical protein